MDQQYARDGQEKDSTGREMKARSSLRTDARVFTSGPDYVTNAIVKYHGCGSDEDRYPLGFQHAAEILAEHAITEERRLDTLVFPIVFLYRHAIELRLKQIVWKTREVLGRDSEKLNKHGLGMLWRKCKPLLEELFEDSEKDSLDKIDASVQEIDRFDPSSIAFRYARTLKGKDSITSLTHVNLRQMRDTLTETLGLLDACVYCVDELLDAKWDMQAEMVLRNRCATA